jgi:hypothetical protein
LWELYKAVEANDDDKDRIPDEGTDRWAEGVEGSHIDALTENAYKY